MSDERGQELAGENGPTREETSRTAGGMVATAAGRTDVGCQRTVNQDTLGNRVGEFAAQAGNLGLLYAVADGMGGHARGEVASALAIEHLFARYYAADPSLEPRQALGEAMIATNSAVHEAGRGGDGKTMGTTLTAVLLRDTILYVGNIGDSRTYLVRGNRIKQLSLDHSLIGEQVRSGLLTEEQARTSSIRNVITRAVGYRDQVEPDTFAFTVKPGDILLLCSDGLHGQVENAELAQFLGSRPLPEAVDGLIELARERGGPDNITALAVRIEQLGEETPATRREQTAEVALIAPGEVAPPAQASPARQAGDTDEIIADDLPTPPAGVAVAPSAARAGSAGDAATQPLATLAPPAPPAVAVPPAHRPPPAPPPPVPAVGTPPATRGARFPGWLLIVLPLLLIILIGAGLFVFNATRPGRNGGAAPGPAATAVVASSSVPAAGAPAPQPTATAAAVPPAPAGAAPPSPAGAPAPNISGGVPTATRPASGLIPSVPSGAIPGLGSTIKISGTITFRGAASAPERFAEEWGVYFLDRAEGQGTARVMREAAITAQGGVYVFNLDWSPVTGGTPPLPLAVEVRRKDGKMVANNEEPLPLPTGTTWKIDVAISRITERTTVEHSQPGR